MALDYEILTSQSRAGGGRITHRNFLRSQERFVSKANGNRPSLIMDRKEAGIDPVGT
jgi:hypothetical protein